ncbi:MAG: hypothetical protein F6K30_03400 [Cyanothece sp. SIO2G6]|nr:hypothetical protein [Cyanothece sp. SIO2G6]
MQFPDEHILMINTTHLLVQNVLDLNQGAIVTGASGEESPAAKMSKLLCEHIYDLALMGQKSFGPDEMKAFVERSNQVLTQLTKK